MTKLTSQIVKLNQLKEDPENIRQEYTEIDELAQNIAKMGQMVPIEVDQDYNIIDGHRRYRALKNLKRDTVWVNQIECTAEEAKLRQIAHEHHNVKATIWDRDQAWTNLFKKLGCSQVKFAEMMGAKVNLISDILYRTEAKFPKDVVNNANVTALTEIRYITPPDLRLRVARFGIKNGWTKNKFRAATGVYSNPTLINEVLNGKIEPEEAFEIKKASAGRDAKDLKAVVTLAKHVGEMKKKIIAARPEPTEVITQKKSDEIKYSEACLKLTDKLYEIIKSADVGFTVCEGLKAGYSGGAKLPLPLENKLKLLLKTGNDSIDKLSKSMKELMRVM